MVLTCKRKQRSIKNSRGQKLVRKEAINQLSPAKQREKGESKIKLIQAIKIKIWEDNQCTVCTNILTNFSFELKRILLTNDKLDKSIHVLFATFQSFQHWLPNNGRQLWAKEWSKLDSYASRILVHKHILEITAFSGISIYLIY